MPKDSTLSDKDIVVSAPVDPSFCRCNSDPTDPPASVCTTYNGLTHCA